MTIKKSKHLIIGSICAVIVVALIVTLMPSPTYAAANEQMYATFTEVNRQINESMDFDEKYTANGLPLALSSNPYDYVADNSEFDKLVKMGPAAIEAIESGFKNPEKCNGLERYILAIALEDIAKVNLKEYEKYMWEDGSSFWESWQQLKVDATTDVPEILNNDNLSVDEKWAEVCKFGILAIEPMERMNTQSQVSNEKVELINDMISILTTGDRDIIVEIANAQNSPST